MLRAAFRSGRSTEELVNGMQSEIFMAMGVQVGAQGGRETLIPGVACVERCKR